jgi:outer membrane protein assembly factor BamB
MNKKLKIILPLFVVIIVAGIVAVLFLINFGERDTIQPNFFKTIDDQSFGNSFAIDGDGNLYIGTSHKQRWQPEGGTWSEHYYLYSFHPNNTLRWQFETNNSEVIKSDPVVHPYEDLVLFVSESYSSINTNQFPLPNATYNKVYAINRDDGSLNWSSGKLAKDITDNCWGSNCLEMAIDSNGYIYAQSQHNITSFYTNGTLRWKNDTMSEQFNYAGSVAIFDDTVYFTSGETHHLYILAFYTNGSFKWKYELNQVDGNNRFNMISFDENGKIYVGSENSSTGMDNVCFYAINPDGTQDWNFTISTRYAKVRGNVAIDSDGTIYLGTKNNDNSEFYALNSDGTLKWKYSGQLQDVYSAPTIADDGSVFFATEDDYIYRLNKVNGQLRSKYQLHTDVTHSSCTFDDDGTLYIGDLGGHLYAIELGTISLANTPWPCLGANFMRTRFMNPA